MRFLLVDTHFMNVADFDDFLSVCWRRFPSSPWTVIEYPNILLLHRDIVDTWGNKKATNGPFTPEKEVMFAVSD